MLNLNDLTASKQLNAKEMANVRGGTAPLLSLFSPTSMPSFSDQAGLNSAVGGDATNTSSMINSGVNHAGKGSQIVAPVIMTSHQSNDNDVWQAAIQAAIQNSF